MDHTMVCVGGPDGSRRCSPRCRACALVGFQLVWLARCFWSASASRRAETPMTPRSHECHSWHLLVGSRHRHCSSQTRRTPSDLLRTTQWPSHVASLGDPGIEVADGRRRAPRLHARVLRGMLLGNRHAGVVTSGARSPTMVQWCSARCAAEMLALRQGLARTSRRRNPHSNMTVIGESSQLPTRSPSVARPVG